MLLNHREDVFPRAKEFLPERFLRGSPWAPQHNFGFLPFSYGPRMCIGRKIAYQEIFCFIIRVSICLFVCLSVCLPVLSRVV
ncbi:Cytochrome P450 27C1 [Portunus trituberculatus]|uniref:Cytochrome P450 27C1 n=1 Tax=Portunus trituberculatus TaxID=210409 RepID=A0A5B7JII6_PORTR|nr:Cytochrome P450 27C1 [Portunus trituberculatus]